MLLLIVEFKVWNAQDNNSRQEPLFKVQSFGTVAKLSWRPTCRYHVACSTLSVDPRIHLWDVRRAYLPQASFCHHHSMYIFIIEIRSYGFIRLAVSLTHTHSRVQ